ncbi:NADH-quinone oxidoreductase subunit H [Siccirubricoccus sp. KC 17139]|uniref:NADH-quinone oxidoreductase subunit H n=1 Tax=Siccirubricoccus soli TaxID=2899147 RepID=A0ABT1DDB3_9PROT|nr:NADH-quinone oxidoreductase subunit H [Siccirubricoccus soli]MCO6419174.1 NADH-quinone oxidoreductase subunit H [Siccirubricoccus soli]MCP2685309.1 NADH-quinone oxidoreductase subunit H [Siccirubricoccus soli]
MLWLGAIVTQLLHIALVLAAAPLVVGVTRWLKARLMGRRGPHLLQPWRDFAKLLRKRPLLAENASAMSELAPLAGGASCLLALSMVPSFAHGMLLAPVGDLILLAGLLALARMALALAGMDVGTAFGGLGAAREMSFAAFAEPALLLCVLTFAILAGTTNLDAVAVLLRDGGLGLRISLGLAAVAMLAVAVAENARIPVDNPATHLELTMVHEAMLLESSGWHLALWEAQSALRLTLWFALLAAIFLPFGTAPAGAGPLAWLLGLVVWAAKMTGLCLALAVFESSIAKMRVFRVPEFLGAALLLALLAVALLFVSTGLA